MSFHVSQLSRGYFLSKIFQANICYTLLQRRRTAQDHLFVGKEDRILTLEEQLTCHRNIVIPLHILYALTKGHV
jgi:hypothetical protein